MGESNTIVSADIFIKHIKRLTVDLSNVLTVNLSSIPKCTYKIFHTVPIKRLTVHLSRDLQCTYQMFHSASNKYLTVHLSSIPK